MDSSLLMTIEDWIIFTGFWALFVAMPGPNALNCIASASEFGFKKSLVCVAAILSQAALFLTITILGLSSIIVNTPKTLMILKIIGIAFLIYIGVKGLVDAGKYTQPKFSFRSLFVKSFLIATINPKSLAGYLAAFTIVINPDVAIRTQMWAIVPTALTITCLNYTSLCAFGSLLKNKAVTLTLNIRLRRMLSLCFILYGVVLAFLSI
jgi:homoserine/homoserine lactone efflux protein